MAIKHTIERKLTGKRRLPVPAGFLSERAMEAKWLQTYLPILTELVYRKPVYAVIEIRRTR